NSALNLGLISAATQHALSSKFDAFVAEYSVAIKGLGTSGLAEGALLRQVTLYADLLMSICRIAPGDSNRKLLLRPLLEIGAVSIEADVTTVVVAPWHPLRMAAIARKAKLVGDLIQRLLSEGQVEFGDQRLY